MPASPVRGLLERIGRSSVKSCVLAGAFDEPGLGADAQSMYDQMTNEVTWPDQSANKVYLAVMVLPVAALYRALRESGLAQPGAVAEVQAAFLATGDRQRSLFKLLLGTDLGRRLFLRSLRSDFLWLTPGPANEWIVTERSETRVTIEVSRCYRWDTFCLLGTPEVAAVACAFEEHMMNANPYLRLTATSMTTGADRCRFCFERQPDALDQVKEWAKTVPSRVPLDRVGDIDESWLHDRRGRGRRGDR